MTHSPVSQSRIHIGAAYYPEHWPEERWPEDIRLMREAGLSVVRMAEFAWSTMETGPGQFHFDWLEKAIGMLAEQGISTVLGTPTAAPPAWLVQQYPDLLAVDENGRRVQFGNRCHYCVTSPDLHAAARRIACAMAERFGENPNVIGWQIDNEYNRVCYCERCQAQFRQFLAEQYGTLDALNLAWSTAYWSQTYSDWGQIPIPIGPHNPGLMLEFKRFVTQAYRKFQAVQIEELRRSIPERMWITHNFMGWYDGFDHYEMSEDLDLASWDWYVGTGHNDYTESGAMHDLVRGFKQRNFWVMETQPGNVNWTPLNTSLNKGEAHAMAWEAVAHGADAVLYWQWRSALGGQEQFHGAILDSSGQPRPFYEEVQQTAGEFARVSHLINGSVRKARVAMLFDYESRWSLQWQRHTTDFDYVKHFLHYYKPLAARNIAVDILPAKSITEAAQLSDYWVVIAPALAILDEPLAGALKGYVTEGGHLVFTVRSGMKDRRNALLPERQPGLLRDVAGVEVEEYFALHEPVGVEGNWFYGQSQIWAERLKVIDPDQTPVIARYSESNGWLDGQPGITVNGKGAGLFYYVGMYLDEPAQNALIDRLLQNANLSAPIQSSDSVEVQARVNADGKAIYFAINHNQEKEVVQLPWPAMDHLTGQRIEEQLLLEPYGVAVLTQVESDVPTEPAELAEPIESVEPAEVPELPEPTDPA